MLARDDIRDPAGDIAFLRRRRELRRHADPGVDTDAETGGAGAVVIAAPSMAASATALAQTAIAVFHRVRIAAGLWVITVAILL